MNKIDALQYGLTNYCEGSRPNLDVVVSYNVKSKQYTLKTVEYSSWRIVRFFQERNFWWNSERYQSKQFTASLLNALTIPSLQKNHASTENFLSLDITVQKAAREIFKSINPATDLKNHIEFAAHHYQKNNGDEISREFQKQIYHERTAALKEKFIERCSDKKMNLATIATAIDTQCKPKIVTNNQTDQNVDRFLDECANFVGEKPLQKPVEKEPEPLPKSAWLKLYDLFFGSTPTETPSKKIPMPPKTTLEKLNLFFEGKDLEKTQLIKLFRICFQWCEAGNVEMPYHAILKALNWSQSSVTPNDIKVEIKGEKLEITLQSEEVWKLQKSECRFMRKIKIECDKSLTLKNDNVQFVVVKPTFGKKISSDEALKLKRELKFYQAPKNVAFKPNVECKIEEFEMPPENSENMSSNVKFLKLPLNTNDRSVRKGQGYYPRTGENNVSVIKQIQSTFGINN